LTPASAPSRPSAREFTDGVNEALEAAEDSAGAIDRYYQIGGEVVRMRFAGPALLPVLTPAFEHLEISTAPAEPQLTIHFWDAQSTGVGMPFLDVWNDCTDRGVVRGFEDSGLSVTRLQMAGVCGVLDASRGQATYWASSADEIPPWERGAPLRAILHAWWRDRGGLLLHAGAVAEEGGGALLIGKGGSGKSTAALACLRAGMEYLSDDYCLLIQGPRVTVNSLYCSAKLHADDMSRFPNLVPIISNADELGTEKAIYFLRRGPECRIETSADLRAILMPRVTGLKETRLTPASPIEAIKALAPSAIFQLPDAGPTEFARIAEVIKQTPCYHLECGTDLRRIPVGVKEAISR
jgi:hypothetical protein